MSWGGAALAMVQAIKNNEKLRSKHTRYFKIKHKKVHHRPFLKIRKKLSPSEKLTIKQNVEKQNKKRTLMLFFAWCIAILITTALVVYIYNLLQSYASSLS